MKKILVMLMISFIVTISATYAKSDDSKVPESVTTQFYSDFSHVRQVKWERIGFYYKASFSQHGTTTFAFYTEDADFMGMANYLLSNRLPGSLQSALKMNYGDYWITDLFKFSNNDKSGYVISLENADQQILLKSDENQNWYVYKTIKKD